MLSKKMASIFMAVVLVMCIGLTACGGSSQESTTKSAPTTEASTSESKPTAEATGEPAEAPAEAVGEPAEAPAEAVGEPAEAPAQTTNAPATDSYIGEEAAKEAALTHAGLTAADVTGLRAELDLDDATVHYDVDFQAGNTEYDYDIDATTGAVLFYESEIDD